MADNNQDPLYLYEDETATVDYRAKQTVEEYQPTRLDALGAAFVEDNLIGSVGNFVSDGITNIQYSADPNFKLENNLDLFDGVDSEYWDSIREAKSREHGEQLRNKYGKYTKDAAYLDELGLEGIAYRTAALFGDVPLISAIQKARGVGKVANFMDNVHSSYGGRVLVAGLTEGTFEAAKQYMSPQERSEMDFLLALGVGGIVGGLYNPNLKMDDEVLQVIKGAVADTVTTKAAGKPLTQNKTFQKIVEDMQVNVTAAFAKAPSPTMNARGQSWFHNVLSEGVEEFKAVEIRDQVSATINNAFSINFNPLFTEFMEKNYRASSKLTNHFKLQKQEEFYNLAGDIYFNRSNPLIDSLDQAFIGKMESAFKKMNDDVYDTLERAGHSKFTTGAIERQDDYMPLRWLTDKIQASVDSGRFTRKDFRNLVKAGLQSKFKELGVEVADEKLKLAAERFTSKMMQKPMEIGKEGAIAREQVMTRALDELQDIMELTDEEIALLRGEIDARQKQIKGSHLSSSTKFRTPLDLNAEAVTEAGEKISLKDFVDTNIQSLWHRYANSMGGDTALRASGFESIEDIAKERAQIVKELSGGTGNVSPKNQKYLDAYDQSVAHFLGRSNKANPDGDDWKAVRILNNMTRSARLGVTWFSMAVELARVAHRNGLSSMIKTMPALKEMTRAYTKGDYSALVRESQLHEALSGELYQMASINKYDEMLNDINTAGSSRLIDRAERVSELAAEATAMLGGVKSGTAILEYWFSISARSKMMDMARKGLDKKGYFYFKQFGFEKEQADAIAAQINKFSNKDPNYPLLNLDKWEGNLGHQWSLGVRRQSYQLVQKANFGDHLALTSQGRLFGDTPFGALALNLKSYMITAYNKQLSKNVLDLSRGGDEMLDTFGNWGFQTAFAAASYIAKMYSQHGGDEEKLDKMLAPERIIANTFSMTTFSTLIPPVVDTLAQGVSDEPLFNTYIRGEAAGLPSIAPLDYLQDVATVPTTAMNLLSPTADATEYELNRALSTLPLSNALGVKKLTGWLAENLAEKDN